MAYIAPNSTVQFFGDLSLNPNYDDTLYFASTAAKDSYFDGVSKLATATALSYTREQRNFLRVELPMSRLINASYIRFKNTSFENKWFYAFVKNVEYINNNCTQVNFELDVMMTWMGAFTLHECFIERQHTVGDKIGANICDEGLETGEYICEGTLMTNLFDNYAIYIFQSEDVEGEIGGVMYGGIYSGLFMYYCQSIASANQQIEAMINANKADSIVMIMMLPTSFIPDHILGSAEPTTNAVNIPKPYSSLNGYIPRNKKLYVYPYCFLTVYNTEGTAIDYRYEYFNTLPDDTSTGNAQFEVRASINAQPEIACYPKNYKGFSKAYSEKISITNFPKCAWGVDAYKAYIAMQQSNLPVALSNARTQVMAGMAMGRPLMSALGAYSGLKDISNLLSTQIIHPSMPSHAKGQQTNDLFVGMKAKNFYFYQMCITKNYAMMIDSYFDMYGYAVRQHGVPNMNARPNWTYVKTIGCAIGGDIPADDAKAIEDIFNNGVRFWKNHNNIGNYSLANAPV